MSYAVQFTPMSRNAKVGLMPVSTTSDNTCPSSCPLLNSGCYAKQGPLGGLWRALSKVTPGEKYSMGRNDLQSYTWKQFCKLIRKLPKGTLWRHNQAGDLPGIGDDIDTQSLAELVSANRGRKGFTYTHKPLTEKNANAIKEANTQGFTINLSADNLAEADTLADANIGPIVVVLPDSVHGNVPITTPKGRKVSVCPATYRDDVSCASCQLCQRQNRKSVVGFPAHGPARRKASLVATSK